MKPIISLDYFNNELAEKTILLVHGYACDSRVWKSIIEPISNHFSVITLDLPGYNTQEDIKAYFTLKELASQIAEQINSLDLTKIIFLGHSMGGYIGLEFLSQFPDLLDSLVLLNSHCFTDSQEKSTNRTKTINFLERRGSQIYINEIYKTLFGNEFYEKNSTIINELKENAKKYPVETLINSCSAMIERVDHSDTIKTSSIPIHFLLGDRDALIPIDEYSSMLMLNPHIQKHKILNNCGHMGMYEAKDEVVNYLINL